MRESGEWLGNGECGERFEVSLVEYLLFFVSSTCDVVKTTHLVKVGQNEKTT